ncbi:protein BTG4 isoform X2 [Kryptolebias marmoratus]|uniref:protein BTG4 isoform X2 n=1 Tax=Kryptolebias marmoratus TaxID=37003 RepID=UPI0007F8BC3A|nr:protein BTG4 isoform X2 [Kryptolebias marmoratus]
MKEEIAAAVFFMARLVKRYGCLGSDRREQFSAALTSVLFENYKNHWHPNAPSKGQAYRCLRMNWVQLQDPLLQQACERSEVLYEDLGLPRELTVWVDPGEVSCSCRRDGEFSRRIHDAVERASLEVQSGSSSDEEDEPAERSTSSTSSILPAPGPPTNQEAKSIPTVSNPNSVYRFSEFSPGAPQTWLREKRKMFSGDSFQAAGGPPPQFSNQKGFKSYRATFTFSGPRVDKYHWVSKSRS